MTNASCSTGAWAGNSWEGPCRRTRAVTCSGTYRTKGADHRPERAAYQTRMRMDFHTDMLQVDVLGLFCMRRAKSGGESKIVSALTVPIIFCRRRRICWERYSDSHLDWRGEEPQGKRPIQDSDVQRTRGAGHDTRICSLALTSRRRGSAWSPRPSAAADRGARARAGHRESPRARAVDGVRGRRHPAPEQPYRSCMRAPRTRTSKIAPAAPSAAHVDGRLTTTGAGRLLLRSPTAIAGSTVVAYPRRALHRRALELASERDECPSGHLRIGTETEVAGGGARIAKHALQRTWSKMPFAPAIS